MTRHDKTILVIGGTGKQGGATAKRLLADGRPVRALVRDPGSEPARALAAAGADLVPGDLDAPETFADALAGVHGVFAIPPAAYGEDGWDTELEYERGARLVDAAGAAGVGHFVFSSIATFSGASVPGSTGKHRIEERIQGSGMAWTILRPVRFMENYLLRDTPVDGLHNGVHRHFFKPDRPMQIIAVADIAAFTALAFDDPDSFGGKLLELAGDDPTPAAAAAAIGSATGSDVRYERAQLHEAEEMGPEIADTWKLLDGGDGWHADLPELRRLHPGLMSLEDWLAAGGAQKINPLRP